MNEKKIVKIIQFTAIGWLIGTLTLAILIIEGVI